MIGRVEISRDIPAGATIYYDADKNALVVFNQDTGLIYVMAMPFANDWQPRDPRVKLP